MAMGRNKYIYSQSLATIVIKSDYKKGGTWSGATEALKKGYCKVFCKEDKDEKGNINIIKSGAIPINEDWDCSLLENLEKNQLFRNESNKKEKNIDVQLNLFDN